jgi:hypothetical protein
MEFIKALITVQKENWALVKCFATMKNYPVGMAADYLLSRGLQMEGMTLPCKENQK